MTIGILTWIIFIVLLLILIILPNIFHLIGYYEYSENYEDMSVLCKFLLILTIIVSFAVIIVEYWNIPLIDTK